MDRTSTIILIISYVLCTIAELIWMPLPAEAILKMNGFMLATILFGGFLGHKMAAFLSKKYRSVFGKSWVYLTVVFLVYLVVYGLLYLAINPFSFI